MFPFRKSAALFLNISRNIQYSIIRLPGIGYPVFGKYFSVLSGSSFSVIRRFPNLQLDRVAYNPLQLTYKSSGIFKRQFFVSVKKDRCSENGKTENGTDHEEQRTTQQMKLGAKKFLAYTCKVCSTKNSHTFSKQAYEEGIVIVTCSGCNSKHLIADNLGWFKHVDKRYLLCVCVCDF